MKKTLSIVGSMLVFIGVIFLLIHSFVIIKDPAEPFARDIFGLIIPSPPLWTSYIPYLGFFIGTAYEFFSIHGLVGIVISIILFVLGIKLIDNGKKEEFE